MAVNSGSVTMTSTQIARLNQSMEAAQNVQLGTRLSKMPAVSGSYTVVTADLVGVSTILLSGYSGIRGFIVQDYRSGSQVSASALYKVGMGVSGSNLVVNSGSTLSGSTLIVGDVLNYILF
jgi:hypothetical protein